MPNLRVSSFCFLKNKAGYVLDFTLNKFLEKTKIIKYGNQWAGGRWRQPGWKGQSVERHIKILLVLVFGQGIC